MKVAERLVTLAWFGKKKAEQTTQAPEAAGGETAVAGDGKEAPFQGDPRKARQWFQRARTVAETRNYDYAIECYISGLKFDPESIQYHEELHEVAKRRKVNGGKPAGLKERMTYGGGKNAVEKAMNAEFLWAKDPINHSLAINAAVAAGKAGLPEMAYWMGGIALEVTKGTKPNKSDFLKLTDLFEQIGAWDKATESIRLAMQQSPGDMAMLKRAKDIEAELTMMKARYDEEGGGFRKSIKDADKQMALEQDDALTRTGAQLDQTIARLRTEYEANTEDYDKLNKLIAVLQEKDTDEAEAEAVKLLEEAAERSGQYRFKMKAGDLKIKGYKRRLRNLKVQLTETTDEPRKKALQEIIAKTTGDQVRFELEDFAERAKNYPTDMGLRYQLGLRQLALGDIDSAISSFQEAQSDPKHRAVSLRYLGDAFYRKEWLDEAVDTFHRGIEVHPYTDDRLALELRYELCRALEAKARRDQSLDTAQEAAKIASQIAQSDINYKDIRNRIDSLRKLISELRSGGSGPNPSVG